ncbi:FAD-binding oxidoreductase [bacterium]|nr:FAD-binding oxidoreductase [bacterium]MBU1917817.1 FAD-binding oxidoreductase [bacterium]
MDKDTNKQIRYWGWGQTNHEYDRDKTYRFLKTLTEHFGLSALPEKLQHAKLEAFKVPKSLLPQNFITKWKSKGLSLDSYERLLHAAGKSYRDVVRVRNNQIPRFPDGVLFLEQSDHIKDLYTDAIQHGITIIPFGGGSGVVGGTECIGPNEKPVLVVDLTLLRRLLSIDSKAMTAQFEAGIYGPKLEQALNAKGYTLGHFPQSFEFSTLGGWIATRSAGQNSTLYGKIEDMVQSLTIHTPQGILETNHVPASATGPSLKQLLIGSEGIYGMITEATVKISPLPQTQNFVTMFFKSYEQGIDCIREIMQAGLKPSIVRLSDPDETNLYLQLMLTSALKKTIVPYWFKWKKLGKNPCFALIATEGNRPFTNFQREKIRALVRQNRGVFVEKSFDQKWKKDRFELPYLRDDLLDHGFFIDTLETAAPWSCLMNIYESMKFAFLKHKKDNLLIACHLSHAYKDGASLYFTFIGRQRKGHEIEQWEKIKNIASDIIIEHGGTISHHHGIGYDHKKWLSKEESPLGIDILKAVKKELDPENILNPGKVF